jgi:6,7-dimethyl-8-ribityllumazine synthase
MNKIAIVTSTFNHDITGLLTQHAIKQLQQQGFTERDYTLLKVPGAVELPFAAQCAIQSGAQGVIIFGSVIRGDTNHYDYVCQQASYGCQKVMLENNRPVIFGVLTTDNKKQALDRADGSVYNVGGDCVDTLLNMMAIRSGVDSVVK